MSKSSSQTAKVTGLLTDTWWYALSQRLPNEAFFKLARLRRQQGFSAIQMVVGIPPEIGPENPNAASTVGPAWTLQGDFNGRYLELAAQRVTVLNELGLRVIIYGAWGQHIDWLGRNNMIRWWREIVERMDALDVIYCLTGESNLWIGNAKALLPDRTTGELWRSKSRRWLPNRVAVAMRRVYDQWRRRRHRQRAALYRQRRRDWSAVLGALAEMTSQPLIVHTNAGETGYEVVDNVGLLSANTTQTGHSQQVRNDLWQVPIRELDRDPQQKFINLEPWYEGITDDFYAADQLYAYWVTMLAGAASYCYGAHGIWNVGDGHFLSHWGKQTFDEARRLDTPRLLGLSHQQFLPHQAFLEQTTCKTADNQLVSISRSGPDRRITFCPDCIMEPTLPGGRYWLPMAGTYVVDKPAAGAVVIFES